MRFCSHLVQAARCCIPTILLDGACPTDAPASPWTGAFLSYPCRSEVCTPIWPGAASPPQSPASLPLLGDSGHLSQRCSDGLRGFGTGVAWRLWSLWIPAPSVHILGSFRVGVTHPPPSLVELQDGFFHLSEDARSGCQPYCPVVVTPVVTTLFLVINQSFLVVTGCPGMHTEKKPSIHILTSSQTNCFPPLVHLLGLNRICW